jgi:hypothetical protein
MTPVLPRISYTDAKFIIDALTAKADRFEALSVRTENAVEKALIHHHAERYRDLIARFQALPGLPAESGPLKET